MTMASADAGIALVVTMLATAVLWLKYFVAAMRVGNAKGKAGKRAPEDTYQASADKASAEALDALDRWQRICANDVENIFPFLFFAWASVGFCLPHGGSYMVHIAATCLFTLARVLHTILYALKISRPRSIAWLIGGISMIVTLVNGIVGSFGAL